LYIFFYYYRDLLHLHSFPTRRSSDLSNPEVSAFERPPALRTERRRAMRQSVSWSLVSHRIAADLRAVGGRHSNERSTRAAVAKRMHGDRDPIAGLQGLRFPPLTREAGRRAGFDAPFNIISRRIRHHQLNPRVGIPPLKLF